MEEISTEDLTPAELKELLKGKKGHKYGAKKTEVDGFVFDSKREAERYAELRIMVLSGEITNLEPQPSFLCFVNGKLICRYFADFSYFIKGTDDRVVEDVKGVKTPVYRLKKKLVEALYKIKITEVI